ncbi:MAG: hypothetical protein GXO15_01370, partial [Crenarchaeota archaeon]|nr:hypothetical protein [Thermoproteota archaeon]
MRRGLALLLLVLHLAAVAASAAEGGGYLWARSVSLRVPAVARTETGYIGVMSNLTVTVAWPGRGLVYVSADPLAEVDMQAAARVAAVIASLIAGYDYRSFDYFVRIEADSPIVGGPSASAAMAVGFLAAFEGSSVRSDFSMTGMIDPDATVGPVGGVPEKLTAAAKAGVKVFAVPAGQLVARDLNTGAMVDLSKLGDQLGVEVYEAYTVLDAYALATGDTRLLDRYTGKPSLGYPDWLRRGLEKSIARFRAAAEGNATCAQELLAGAALGSYRDLVSRLLDEALQALEQGDQLRGRGLLYSAASRYFYAAITATEACILAETLSSRQPLQQLPQLLKPLLEAANKTAGLVETGLRGRLVKAEKLTDIELQLAVAVLSRVQGARESLEAAAKALAAIEAGEPASLQDIAAATASSVYAYYRSLTSLDWYNTLRGAWGLGKPLDPAALQAASRLYVYLVYTEASYSQALGVPVGDALDRLEGVRLLLEQPNATLVDRIDALMNAVQLYADITRSLREAFNTGEAGVEAADRALTILSNIAIEAGYTPVLPLLYQEYASNLPDLDAKLGLLVQGASYALLLDMLSERSREPPGGAPQTATVTVTRTATATSTTTVVVTGEGHTVT